MAQPFVNLHTHSFYSILRALPSPTAILEKAKELGCPAVALTDCGGAHGMPEFFQSAKKIGDIKPIVGAELAIAKGSRYEKRSGIDGHEGYIVALAQNAKGMENLMKLLTVAAIEGFFVQPRIDWEMLEKHKEGLIILTGGTGGELGKQLEDYGDDKATEFLTHLRGVVGDENVYLEIVSRNAAANRKLNEYIVKIHAETKLPVVVTCNAHYLDSTKAEAAETLNCVRTGERITDPTYERKLTGNYFKPWDVIESELVYIDRKILDTARENTLAVADRIEFDMEFGQKLLPNVDVPEGMTEAQVLRNHCEAKIDYRYAPFEKISREEVTQRLDYELSVIGSMGFEAYFLIVEDFIRFARDSKIAVGPGRGSAAGSIVAYLLEITDIDPLGYELLFERFLNPERISMPDIDIDFSDERREEVIHYVNEKYGSDRVSQVCTFGTLSAKAALKDVGRAYGVDFARMNAITKLLPTKPGFKLKDAEEIADFMALVKSDLQLEKVYKTSLEVEGCIRHVSVHACAVIIGKDDLVKHTPQQWAPGAESTKITQWDYYRLEDIGLLKMDFLGLKNLSIIERTLQHIKETTGKEIDMTKIPIDDTKTFKMIADGYTTGVFQFESAGMRRYMRELKPTEFEDLVAMNALYRPGPMEYIPQYIAGKHDPKTVQYPDPILEELLSKTYGIAVYQEQVMKMAQVYSGYTLGQADILRKAVGKKIAHLMAEQREKFIEGGVKMGHKEKDAEKLFDDIIVPFAGYGFNRSHAVCYARIAYETAWLRANYPVQFMASMMTTDRNVTDRIVMEMNECVQMGIEVLPPSVNESGTYFTVISAPGKEKKYSYDIRFGLSAIKGLGEETVDVIIKEREQNGPFEGLANFATRVPARLINKKTLEALSYSGALDGFGDRAAIVAGIEDLSKYAKEIQEKENTGQIGLFGSIEEDTSMEFVLPDKKATKDEILGWEKESMGMFVSDHPLKGCEKYFSEHGFLIGELSSEDAGNMKTIHGIVSAFRKITTKKGKNMAVFTVEDTSGKIDLALFPHKFESVFTESLQNDAFVQVTGKLDERDGGLQILVEDLRVGDLRAIQISEGSRDATDMAEEKPPMLRMDLPDNMSGEKRDALKAKLARQRDDGPEGIPVVLYLKGKKIDLPFKISWYGGLEEDLKAIYA